MSITASQLSRALTDNGFTNEVKQNPDLFEGDFFVRVNTRGSAVATDLHPTGDSIFVYGPTGSCVEINADDLRQLYVNL